jgi:hypothetical protein
MAFREFVNFQISTRVSDLYVALIQEGHSKYAMVMQVISHWRDDHSKILGQSCNMSKQPMMAPSTVCKSVFTNRCMHVSFHKPLYACQFSQTASDGATNQALGEGTSSPTSRSTYQEIIGLDRCEWIRWQPVWFLRKSAGTTIPSKVQEKFTSTTTTNYKRIISSIIITQLYN